MTDATLQHIGGITKEQATQAQKAKESGLSFYVIRESLECSDWVEVIDLRSLSDRLHNPLKGKGVKRYFGDTHKVITKAYLAKMQSN